MELPTALHVPCPRNRRAAPRPRGRGPQARCRRGRLWVRKKGVRGLWRQEGELRSDTAGARRAAEEAAYLTKRESIHPSLQEDEKRIKTLNSIIYLEHGR